MDCASAVMFAYGEDYTAEQWAELADGGFDTKHFPQDEVYQWDTVDEGRNATHEYQCRDEDIKRAEIVHIKARAGSDLKAHTAFRLGGENENLEAVKEKYDGMEAFVEYGKTYIPFGDIHRHPKTKNIEVLVISEDKLKQMAIDKDGTPEAILYQLAAKARNRVVF